MTNQEAIIHKANNGEELTVEEILIYQKAVKATKHVYGKYGTLAKKYLEEYNVAKYWALAGDLPEYLHGIDRQAQELYDTIEKRLREDKRFKRTGNFIDDCRKQSAMQQLIEEEILNELVYVD